MTTLVFLATLAAILVFVIALEADGLGSLKLERRASLITWITSGNWPAKIGGLLVIVGVGALLRYALLNIEIAPY